MWWAVPATIRAGRYFVNHASPWPVVFLRVSGMRKIPGDSQIRAKLDVVGPALFHPMFADIVAELDQCGGLGAMRCLDRRAEASHDTPTNALISRYRRQRTNDTERRKRGPPL